MRTHIALLRGINVGGKNLIKMADLRKMVGHLGFKDPETLLQSGNLVFTSEKHSTEELEKLLQEATEKTFGIRPEYFVRTVREWDELIEKSPFPDAAKADPSHYLAIVMKQSLDLKKVAEVQAAVKGPEQMKAVGSVLYVVYPDGIGTSKLPSTPGWNKLGAAGTGRNWNTVIKLADLARKQT